MPPIHGSRKDGRAVASSPPGPHPAVPANGPAMSRLQSFALAKVNLTLCVLSRRTDGYHELSSLAAFAGIGDELTLSPGSRLELSVKGEFAAATGPSDGNLVAKAARALQERVEGLRLGHFELIKHLPAGAGLGGGSADAAAALRLLAQSNAVDLHDARLVEAARSIGADVPVCLESKARLMHGIGEVLSAPLRLPKLDAVILFPGVPLATKDVFGNFTLLAGPRRKTRYIDTEIPAERSALFDFLASEANDLELAARLAEPAISVAKTMLEESGDARIVRMSGSGSALFALYDNASHAKRAATKISKRKSAWWVKATTLN
jgi:4-diphosphocytidyl-2-C-methyl-D-erythritol kinase